MAERRMFSKAVVSSGRFLRLSPQARLLYYDLGMDADDEGFADAFVTVRRTESKKKYLQELIDQAFIQVMSEEMVVKITDWGVNNRIRKDRITPSRYSHLTAVCQPNDNQLAAQYSIG